MGNVVRIVARDAKRIAQVPAAWIVVLVLIALPSLYAWFNVAGFWDPYGNTGNLRVCVVNEDVPVHDEVLGDLDLGGQIVSQIEADDQLQWDVTDREQAQEAVASGRAYAAVVIPEDFSECVTTLLTDDPARPTLRYYANEKSGPVSPKITDTGANMLDTTVNDAFVSQASAVVAEALDTALEVGDASARAAQTRATTLLDKAAGSIQAAQAGTEALAQTLDEAEERASAAREDLDGARAAAEKLDAAFEDLSALAGATSQGIATVPLAFTGSFDDASALLSQAMSQASGSLSQIATGAGEAQGKVDGALSRVQAAAQDELRILDELGCVQGSLPEGEAKEALGQAIAALSEQNARTFETATRLQDLSTSFGSTVDSVSAASGQINAATQNALASSGDARRSTINDAVPTLAGALSAIAQSSTGLAGAAGSSQALLDQATGILDQFDQVLSTARSALGTADETLAGISKSLATVRTDIAALGSSDTVAQLLGSTVDAEAVASFMMSPTTVDTKALYPVNSYGSAMAPLFINLTLWIGAFMLMVILRLEADDEGVAGATAAQRYLGRWLLLAVIAALQAVVCCCGCLALGVQTTNLPLLFVTAVGASLAYLSVQFMLSTLFQHVGKGLCVVLVFVQIPAATGLYPVEMTPAFFQVVYPLFPFTYGINAMREVIGGFYDGAWAHDMLVLGAFFAASMALGLLLRPHLANLNRLVARQVEEGGIINGERVALPRQRFRVAQIARALLDRDDYRAAMIARAKRFLRRYSGLRRGAVICGVAVPIAATAVLSGFQADKVVLLTVWLVWFLAVSAFLLALEFVRDGLNRQAELGSCDQEGIRALYRRGDGLPSRSSGDREGKGGAR